MRLPASLALSLAFTLSPLAQAASSDPVLAQADQLLASRQSQAAYDLLAPLEDERAGDPDYDYLLGLAALETGRGGVAAFAFERCLAVDPKNGPCRVQMARTHMALGEHKAARLELEAVQGSNPPAAVEDLVARYLGTVSRLQAREKQRVGGYVQLGAGYDTNVTSMTADTLIAAPGISPLPVPLATASTKQEDVFLQAEAGANIERSLSAAWTLLGDLSASARGHDDVDRFNSLAGNAGLGAAWREGENTVVTRLQLQDYQLDGNAFRSLYGRQGNTSAPSTTA